MQGRKSYRVHYIIVVINEIPAHTTRVVGEHYYTLNCCNGREGRVWAARDAATASAHTWLR